VKEAGMTLDEYYQLYGSRITQDSERLFINDFLYPLLGSSIQHIEPQHQFLGVHAGESQKNPAQFAKDSKAEAGLPHDKRPQEQRANAVQKAQGPAIAKAVKQIEKERKKEQKNQ
jgi:hypothetical protein